jgi:hypothetical protein
VKSVISRPEFAYETSTDIAVYREKSKWCKILAEENLGILVSKTVWWWWHYSRLFCSNGNIELPRLKPSNQV